MKFELLILTITGFVLLNTYFDGKLISKLKHYEKYYKMALIAFIGLCIYLFIKKNPANYKDFVHNTKPALCFPSKVGNQSRRTD